MSAPRTSRRVLVAVAVGALALVPLAAAAASAGAPVRQAGAGAALGDPSSPGGQLFQTNCATCHGVNGLGTSNGPSLAGVGTASVDFMLSTGGMPLNQPDQEPVRQPPKFTPAEIAAIVDYLEPVVAGGPPIPAVDPSAGDLSVGSSVFLEFCAPCHAAGAIGDSVGGGQIAPSLNEVTPTQVGEAIRTGPGVMPKFGPETISDEDLDSIAAYLAYLRTQRNPGGFDLGKVGPYTEGFAAFLIGLGLLLVVIRLTGTKT
jgi:ubiquinol-cytochrome c reductase cytochrome c subunit